MGELKRIYVDIDSELHQRLKREALEQGRTLKGLIEHTLNEAFPKTKRRRKKTHGK